LNSLEKLHMPAITIRTADSPALAKLVTQLGYPTSTAEMDERLRTLLGRPEYVHFVAESEGLVIGLVGAYPGVALEFSGAYGRLTGLVVDGGCRGSGVGKMLMERIEGWLRERGARMATLTSGKQRKSAHGFYRRLGCGETGLRFAKKL
jgi:ribosomal protein S18 acetylase RimI-like enzyme